MTPFSREDPDWEFDVRPARTFSEGQLSKEANPVPGFVSSGRGAFEIRLRSKRAANRTTASQTKYLHIYPAQLVGFPKGKKEEHKLENILPLVVGPIEIIPSLKPTFDTSLPLELWQNSATTDMVYDGYRVFSTSQTPPVNIAIHEMWDSGIPGKIWDSALVMLDVIKKMIDIHPEYINQKHVLDLSAGTGLLGLYIASMMASPNSTLKQGKITITELNEAVDLIDQNIEINRFLSKESQVKLRTRNLLWGNTEQAEACGKADLIIASDVLYEAQFFEDLVKAFVDLGTKTTRIYIGYKRRGFDEAEERRFWALCKAHFSVKLLVYQGQDDEDDGLVPPMTIETGVKLYRLTLL
ncbi:putative methyltransferase-domain-containing protein [Parasitella parasitica]|nr:putative methyltransferase-domain-containing protein [Parasitella parasitica]